MRKGLGLSEQAIHRIGRSLAAQAYAVDPTSGDFIMPEGSPVVPVADTEGRLKALEDNVGNLQVQVEGLEMAFLQSSYPQEPEQKGWEPTSWWDRFKQVVMPDQIPGAEQPEPYQEDNPSFQYIGSKMYR
jgi:hypothetical protein